ncbi:hypothetical protein FRC11_007063 [Ceratobasidium sp. 423]|nr:hypothetical protein FRC11_007063 [Ceratobasidium sp. 423]
MTSILGTLLVGFSLATLKDLKLGRRCVAYNPDTFKYIGTAAAVRDMIAIHAVLEGPEKPIDYWGVSCGTAIGSYFINMFPNRVGRVVVDGDIDPVYWANRPALTPRFGNI